MILMDIEHSTKIVKFMTSGFRFQGGARLVIHILFYEIAIENLIFITAEHPTETLFV